MMIRHYGIVGAAIYLGSMILTGCGTNAHPVGTAPTHHSQTVSPSPATSPSTSSTPPSSRSVSASPTHTSSPSPKPPSSSTPSRIAKGQNVVVTSTKGFSENATLFPTGWQVSDNTPNTTSILIANQNAANFVSYMLGMTYSIFSYGHP